MSPLKKAFLLLFIHASLATYAAWTHSPAWDEIVYPAAGYDFLATNHWRVSLDHPPLGKALLALPLFLTAKRLQTAPPGNDTLDAYRNGFNFTYSNRLPAPWMIFLPRMANIVLSCLLAVCLYLIASRLWGGDAGVLAMMLYVLCPPVLARASLALLEMPLAFFMTLSVFGAIRWRRRSKPIYFIVWTLSWMAALLTKANAAILLPAFFLSDLLECAQRMDKLPRRLAHTALASLIAFGGAELAMRAYGQSYWTGQLLARRSDFMVSRFPMYFHGSFWNSAMFYMAPTAWLLKTPVSFVALAAAGWWVWRRLRPQDEAYALLSCVFLITGLVMLCATSNIATGQYFYLYPLLALTAAPVVMVKSRRGRDILTAIAAGLILSCLWASPRYLTYFNFLAGGSSHGDRWLADSDQDWGQELPALAHWMKEENLTQILLGYSGAGDPRVYGIRYQDIISPALITATYRGENFKEWPGRVVLVLSGKVVQTESYYLGWLLQHRAPVQKVADTFVVYDLTHDPEALKWLAAFYHFTHRPALAEHIPQT